ncbi:hypothetical protein M9H77_26915 [Catharanthus roseus]|uniref:Uncharacterized protein n=1 Tax=Catharanthus roseus TaxID=4058 RepID=A0ACC0AB21_CATRO|nr:hypothetical protein M9H77_26915 [Catharanthus roseus]
MQLPCLCHRLLNPSSTDAADLHFKCSYDICPTSYKDIHIAVHFFRGSRGLEEASRYPPEADLPSPIGAKDQRHWRDRDLSQTVGLTLPSAVDYSHGCLELKKEEQSRATNWGLIGAIV